MVFNATFNNISVISWRSVLLVEETDNTEKTTDLSQVTDKLDHHNVVHLALNNWLVQYDNKLVYTVNIHCIWSTMNWFHCACITGTNTKANACFLHLVPILNITWSSLNLNISLYERIMSCLVEYLRYYHKEHNMQFYNWFA